MSDWNTKIIEEFRANGGEVGGAFAGRPLLLLHHKGAKSGTHRVTPLMYEDLDEGYAVFASKGGADTNPDWLYNLKANPQTSIEVGNDRIDVRARIAEGEEHEIIWEKWKRDWHFFAEYEAKTSRDRIPVVVLEPA